VCVWRVRGARQGGRFRPWCLPGGARRLRGQGKKEQLALVTATAREHGRRRARGGRKNRARGQSVLRLERMGGSEEGAGSERPMRRSRMLSDDARLALQLQDEELKAARGMKRPKPAAAAHRAEPSGSVKRAKNPSDAGASSKAASKGAGRSSGGGSSSRGVAGQGAGHVEPSAKSKGAPRANPAGYSLTAPVSRPDRAGGSGNTNSKAANKSNPKPQAAPSDKVSFKLEPWPSAQEDVPELRRSSMTLQEDQTILSIKRKLVEEAYPGTDVSKVEIRTPTGIKCGQDHSLKYVRSFLWPISKGDLVLYYCQAAESFL